ncbi:hypothetical protein BY458DRAFT_561121 [Sporodiniella umbellata]|nr:hypothetical protein BY458DRAFT_561121 [Sporodiniella umbellata]
MVSSENITSVLTDWHWAVTQGDRKTMERLLKVEPELLWTPMSHPVLDHLELRLTQLGSLGSSFQPLCAIHICLMEDRPKECIHALLDAATPHDLDTRFWGQADNTLLHLAYFLNHTSTIDHLLTLGVSQPKNKLGFRPQDLSSEPHILGSLHKKKSEHHYFRKGKVKETRQKVLGEEEEPGECLQQSHHREVAQLAQRSAVKNNPLYQKLEKRTPKRPPNYVLVETQEDGDPHFVFEPETCPNLTLEEPYEGVIKVEYPEGLSPCPAPPPTADEALGQPAKAQTTTTTTLSADRKMKRRSGSQKAAWSMSMSSWAAILDREFNLSDLNQAMIAPQRTQALPEVHSQPDIEPIAHYGKFYLRVQSVQDILLPLPKDRAFVRCVVSDGRFEYMSRYEVLKQTIDFEFECLIDTHPDMIITLSLHVRPDFIMKAKKPFSRLFSSRKKKECLSGYVLKEDGALGQSRFALAHMIPACHQLTYHADFDCFNAWYSKSFKERHRQKKKDQDVLKVVGNFHVQMLYLTQTNSLPKTLAAYSSHA